MCRLVHKKQGTKEQIIINITNNYKGELMRIKIATVEKSATKEVALPSSVSIVGFISTLFAIGYKKVTLLASIDQLCTVGKQFSRFCLTETKTAKSDCIQRNI